MENIIERQEKLPNQITTTDSSEWSRSDILTLIGVIFAGFLGIVSIWLACRVEKIARTGLRTQLMAERREAERKKKEQAKGLMEKKAEEEIELDEIRQNETAEATNN